MRVIWSPVISNAHHHGDAVLLGYQAGLAVDHAFQERQAGCPGALDIGATRLDGVGPNLRLYAIRSASHSVWC